MIQVNLYNGKLLYMSRKVPANWDELNRSQFAGIARILFAETADFWKQRIELVCLLMNINPVQLRRIDEDTMLNELVPLCEWVFTDSTITKQHQQSIKLGWYEIYGPYDHLRNLVLKEFDSAERELYAWHLDKSDTDALYRFIACLYRPKKKGYNAKEDPEGDIREPFNGNLVAAAASRIKSVIPIEEIYGIVLWYKGCRAWMMERHPNIFTQSNTSEDEEGSNMPEYFSLMRRIAEKGTYGTFSDVEQLPIYTALEEMECTIADNEYMKQRMEEIKNGTHEH